MKNKKTFWFAVAVASAAYVVIPEPTDVIPLAGWIDEGVALSIFWYALKQLGVSINPFKKNKAQIIEINKN